MNLFTQTRLKNVLTDILIYFLIIYTFVMLGRSVFANYKLKKDIVAIEQNITQLKSKNQNLNNLLLYYQTDAFREVEARQKLGLKKPGETVVDVQIKDIAKDYQSDTQSQQQNIATIDTNTPTTLSNPKLWWQYFFK